MDSRKVNSEVLGVLMFLGMDYISKVPDSIMDYITKNSDKNLIPKIEKNTPLNKMPISREAQAFITLLNLQYFCETQEQKNKLINRIKENSRTNNN